MASGDNLTCEQYSDFLVSQTPLYEKAVLADIRPVDSEWLGFYQTGVWNAFGSTTKRFDRFTSVYPNLTNEWETLTDDNCSGSPCDPEDNEIGWGNNRGTFSRQRQSWTTQLVCYDDIMKRTEARQHFEQIISKILQPTSKYVMNHFLTRMSLELADKRFVVATGLPEFTFTWDAGGYVFLNTTEDPTGILTTNILQSRVSRLYAEGAINAMGDGYQKLQLFTDKDTARYLAKEENDIQPAWRFMSFTSANEEFFKYGLTGQVGDYGVKVHQFPWKFNKVADGRYQWVSPYANASATNGLGDRFSDDYYRAQYQLSFITQPRALEIQPFQAESVNEMMPFMVRDFAGKWRFATNDLGSCGGKAIANFRRNKGKFWSDFDLAVYPKYPEFLECVFHMIQTPCITIIAPCQTDPGYPPQDYDSANTPCDSVFVITAHKCGGTGNFIVVADGISCDGNVLNSAEISDTTLADLVTSIQAEWDAAGLDGTWAVYSSTENKISLTGSTCESVAVTFEEECPIT